MKKLLTVAISVIIAVLLVTGCSDSGSAASGKTAMVSFGGYRLMGSRDVSYDVDIETKGASELYWTYSASLDDTVVPETALNVVDGTVKAGLPSGSFGEFGYGTWKFTVNAYETYSEGSYSSLYFSGVETDVTINETSSTVYATVVREYPEGTQGTLLIKDIKAYQEDGSEADASGYTINYSIKPESLGTDTISGTDSTQLSLSTTSESDGLQISLDPDYYTITLSLSTTLDGTDTEIASVTASGVYIIKGGTTTVTGSIKESETVAISIVVTATYTDYDADGNSKTVSTQIYPVVSE